MDLVARHWFRDAVILEEEDFSEELPRLRYYSELTEESVIDVLRDWTSGRLALLLLSVRIAMIVQ